MNNFFCVEHHWYKIGLKNESLYFNLTFSTFNKVFKNKL